MRQDPLCFNPDNLGNALKIPLSALFAETPLNIVAGKPDDTLVTGIAIDSRLVQPGFLFVAMQGGSADGHRSS